MNPPFWMKKSMAVEIPEWADPGGIPPQHKMGMNGGMERRVDPADGLAPPPVLDIDVQRVIAMNIVD